MWPDFSGWRIWCYRVAVFMAALSWLGHDKSMMGVFFSIGMVFYLSETYRLQKQIAEDLRCIKYRNDIREDGKKDEI